MKKYLILILTLVCTSNAFSQVFGFDSAFLVANDQSIYAYKRILIDDSFNKYIGGFYKGSLAIGNYNLQTVINNTYENSRAIFIAKYDKNDSLVWVKKIAESDTLFTFHMYFNHKQEVAIGLEYIGKVHYENDSSISKGGSDVLILQLDSLLSPVLKIDIGGINGEGLCYQGFDIDKNGNYFIAGSFNYTWTNNYPNYQMIFGNDTLESINQKIFIAKYDSLGNPIWAKSYGGAGIGISTGISISNDNLYISGILNYAGSTNDIGGINISYPINYTNKAFFARLNPINGTSIWVRRFGDNNVLSNFGGGGISIKDSKFYIYSNVFSNNQNVFLYEGGPTLSTSIFNSGSDFSIACYDTSGNFNWNTISDCIGGEGISEIIADSNGSLLAVGTYDYILNFPTDTLFNNGGRDIFAFCYDSLGIFKWAINGGGAGADIGSSITLDSNNKPYIVGGTTSNPCYMGNDTLYPTLGQSTLFVSTIDSNINPVGINTITDEDKTIIAFPNPVNDYLQLKNVKGSLIISLYNQIGQKISIKEIGNNKIDTSHLPNGIYYLSIRSLQNSLYKTIHIQH